MDKELVIRAGEIKTPPLSHQARHEVGVLLRQLQQGILLSMPHSRPMPQIGAACHELRINDGDRTWRFIYFIDTDAIVILAIFSKTTNTTPDPVKAVCKQRLSEYRATVRAAAAANP